ncbi:MAG: hypothetical protein VX745_06110, partial [Pseudomonadota bacterium]|nr:hypothetical protein [Pseudomonadota bacterium]
LYQRDGRGETSLFELIQAERVDTGVTVEAECLKAAIKHRFYKEEILAILPHGHSPDYGNGYDAQYR